MYTLFFFLCVFIGRSFSRFFSVCTRLYIVKRVHHNNMNMYLLYQLKVISTMMNNEYNRHVGINFQIFSLSHIRKATKNIVLDPTRVISYHSRESPGTFLLFSGIKNEKMLKRSTNFGNRISENAQISKISQNKNVIVLKYTIPVIPYRRIS